MTTADWAPEAEYPTDPEFYRRVLHHLPSPVVVVNGTGQIVYVNQAMLLLGEWDIGMSSRNILDHVHPDDREELTAAFVEIVESPGARVLGTGRPWAEIYFRILTANGNSLPVELVGSGGLLDPAVEGIIYEVRPARTRTLLGRVLDGLSQGASMHHLLSLIATMIASPPLDLDAVILRSTTSNSWVVAASTSQVLSDAVRGDSTGLPWNAAVRRPAYSGVEQLPARTGERLAEAGYQDLWHVGVDSPLTANTLRLVAVSPTHHVPAAGPLNRLVHARELAAAVLLRSEADVLLDHAAAHDRLTDLPNRAAFHQRAEAADPLTDRAAIHLDLDGLKQVNSSLGQATGDAVLVIVADRLRATCPTSAAIGRVGDDEFTVLIGAEAEQGVDLMAYSIEVAREVLAAIHVPIIVGGRALNVSTSIGVAVAPAGISTDHLLTWADAAMHDAKQAGGGQVCRYGVAFG